MLPRKGGALRSAGTLTVIALLFSLGSYAVQGQVVAAQTLPDDGWSLPVDLAAARPGRALFPTMIADRNGGIHAFWTEEVELGGRSRHSVVYAYGDGAGWAGPVDVFVGSSPGGSASDARATVDDQGVLHTVWNDDLGVMYAQREVWAPVSARTWSKHRLIGGGLGGGVREIQIAQDGEGALHVVFTDSSSGKTGAYYVRSTDRGRTWTSPRLLAEDLMAGRFRHHLLWHDGILHLAFQAEEGVHHLRSDDGGDTWPTASLLQETGSWPQLIGLDKGRLLLLTAGSVREANCVKLQNLSPDNGGSWEETEVLFLPLRGCLANALVQQDSAGNRHLVMSACLVPACVAMVWHVVWQGEEWHPAEPLLWASQSYESLGTKPNFPSAAISGGNKLHALFMDGEGGIWYTRKRLPAAAISPIPYPTRTPAVREAETVVSRPTTAVLPLAYALAAAPPEHGRSALLFLLPALASLAVVAGAILWGRQ